MARKTFTIHFLSNGWGDGSLKYLLSKHEDPSSVSQHRCEKLGVMESAWNLTAGEAGR